MNPCHSSALLALFAPLARQLYSARAAAVVAPRSLATCVAHGPNALYLALPVAHGHALECSLNELAAPIQHLPSAAEQ